MNDFDQLYHHQDGNDINILHYYVMMFLMLDIQIHLNHKLKGKKNAVIIEQVNVTQFHPTYPIIHIPIHSFFYIRKIPQQFWLLVVI
jgi:hypothetical protein